MQKQIMTYKTFMLFLLLAFTFSIASCSKMTSSESTTQDNIQPEQQKSPKRKEPHPYGGWSCPDNIFGFPPVNIEDWKEVPVVNNRLPTKEETRSGISLMYIDTSEYPTAKPLDITMPRLARYYSEYTQKDELVIIIQAVIIDKDTIVGFRNVNGGNGSAWFDEVRFMEDDEIAKLSPSYFVQASLEIQAPKSDIWDAILELTNITTIHNIVNEGSNWVDNSKVVYKPSPEGIQTKGLISAYWENMYLQIDYNFDRYHYVEKYLILENKEKPGIINLNLVVGPFEDDFEMKNTLWSNKLQGIKTTSEKLSK